MITEWEKRGTYGMNINSPDFVPVQEFKGCLEIQRQELSSLKGVKKNGLWLLWHTPPELLRQEGALDTGFILRGCPDLSGGGGSAGIVSEGGGGEGGGARERPAEEA